MAYPIGDREPRNSNVISIEEKHVPVIPMECLPADLVYDIGVLFGYNDPPPADPMGITSASAPADRPASANDNGDGK